jgi:hypothetical protein
MSPLVLSGADLVLSDRVLERGTLVIEGGRIVEIVGGTPPSRRVDISTSPAT